MHKENGAPVLADKAVLPKTIMSRGRDFPMGFLTESFQDTKMTVIRNVTTPGEGKRGKKRDVGLSWLSPSISSLIRVYPALRGYVRGCRGFREDRWWLVSQGLAFLCPYYSAHLKFRSPVPPGCTRWKAAEDHLGRWPRRSVYRSGLRQGRHRRPGNRGPVPEHRSAGRCAGDCRAADDHGSRRPEGPAPPGQ